MIFAFDPREKSVLFQIQDDWMWPIIVGMPMIGLNSVKKFAASSFEFLKENQYFWLVRENYDQNFQLKINESFFLFPNQQYFLFY